jgi:D-alanine--poly(phosphoribitol) ligase subunit 1
VSLGEIGATASHSVLDDIIRNANVEPNRLAAKDLDRALSYAQLIDDTARISAGLVELGVSEDDRVALLIPNSVDFLAAALACLWVGAVFVPMAVTDPTSRLERIVADCTPVLIVTADEDATSSTALRSVRMVPIHQLRRENRLNLGTRGSIARVAYMIYTSGTTGAPKGVQISNTAFAAAVHSTAEVLALSGATKMLCVSPFHFDGAYANLFPTLVSGGTVVMRPRDALLFPRLFFNTVSQEEITHSGFTPSYLRLLLASRQLSELADSTLEVIALGGEAFTVADLRSLWSRVPALRVFNRYGPTETTIAVTNVELTPGMVEGGRITIGRPHPGVSFVLVDEEGQVVDEANRTAELYVGGVQLMDGYWADPVLTQEVLRSDVVSGMTLYRTGDLVYRDESDNYFYVDRADRVVKRSGVRISLVELSSLISQIDGVVSAACVTFDWDGGLGIVAFVVTDVELTDVEVRRAARELIPENMLPDRIERVATMPLNRSNQLDETRLLAEAGLRPLRPISAK